jgi:hypothetical protein
VTGMDELVLLVAQRLEQAGIPYTVCGSIASGIHGDARATADVDIIISPTAQQLDAFLNTFGEDFYVSRDAAHDSLRRKSMFNIILIEAGLKADLIILDPTPFHLEEFRRRTRVKFGAGELAVLTPEDVILGKLDWSKESRSDRQRRDALWVAVSQWETLDKPYLSRWAAELGVAEDLAALIAEAEALRPQKSDHDPHG